MRIYDMKPNFAIDLDEIESIEAVCETGHSIKDFDYIALLINTKSKKVYCTEYADPADLETAYSTIRTRWEEA